MDDLVQEMVNHLIIWEVGLPSLDGASGIS
jgi:hypothetical protein